jgi:ABC-type microcin C transport system duplicated ATPase subunit YejF
MVDTETQTVDEYTRDDVLLEVKDLKAWFPIRKGFFRMVAGHVKAVDGVSLSIRRGETLGLVGESGCGKTTLGRTILRLVQATGGRVLYRLNGQLTDVLKLDARGMFNMRKRMQVIFQDPYSSLNPRMTVGDLVGEYLRVHGVPKREREQRIV